MVEWRPRWTDDASPPADTGTAREGSNGPTHGRKHGTQRCAAMMPVVEPSRGSFGYTLP